MRRRWPPATLAALAVVFLVAGGITVGLASDSGRGAKRKVGPPANAAVQAARDRFAALRGAGAAPSTLSDRAAEGAPMVTRGKAFSVHTLAAPPAYQFYVLETADGLCPYELSDGGSGGGCTGDMEAFAHGGLDYAFLGDDGFRLTALLPDGATDVTLTYEDGSRDKLGVTHNLGTQVVKRLPARAEWTLPDGSTESRTLRGMPAPGPTVTDETEVPAQRSKRTRGR